MLFYILAKDIHKKNLVMLAFSLIFYTWGEPLYIILLLAMTFVNWMFSLQIERYRGTRRAKQFIVLTVVVDLALLAIFKYTTFILGSMNSGFGMALPIPNIVLPIGISFYTFQILTYVVDVYRGEVPAQKKFSYLLLYVSLFHQLIAGPIVRYKDIIDEIEDRTTRHSDVSKGINRFVTGLGKKVLLANACGSLADKILLSDALVAQNTMAETMAHLTAQPVLSLWLGVLMFMLQIYLDFSAYSDMAIGMGQMIGFHYKENFDYPYLSRSVSEFWRRWHMTLGSFFKDYVYIPLGGNRKGIVRTFVNLFVVWVLTGLWHGASWNFALWGLYFFILIAIEKLFLGELLERIPRVYSHIYLLFTVFFGWILFRCSKLGMIGVILKGLFGLNGNGFTNFETNSLLFNHAIIIGFAILSVTPLMKNLVAKIKRISREHVIVNYIYSALDVIVPVTIVLVCVIFLVADSYNPFLYFQF